MGYSFETLSPIDFEDLSRDLIGARDGLRFEGFSAGPDGGFDGRKSSAAESSKIMLQAKHYSGSQFKDLKRAILRERANVEREKPDRYILTTSVRLTPGRKDELADIIGPALLDTADIVGPVELNDLLRCNPDIERTHFKLWLTSSSVLERFINAERALFSDLSWEGVKRKVKLFAMNASVPAAQSILDKHHVLIISGPPGVGKTTLAEILGYDHVHREWDFVGVASIAAALAAIADPGKKVIFFDDFLGTIELDPKALSASESQIGKLIQRVRQAEDARFILTSRAYILQGARDKSDILSDKKLDYSEYVLDVGVYTRRIKARILYNHLAASDLSQPYIEALLSGDFLKKVVDHPNYIPRVIDWMTRPEYLVDIKPQDYPTFFLDTLSNPSEIWDRPYRTHISHKERHLLITLFFMPRYFVTIDALEAVYRRVHAVLCQTRQLPQEPSDFSSAMRVLEGGFIRITDWGVDFINPSVRDYLKAHLKDPSLFDAISHLGEDPAWPDAVWNQVRSVSDEKPFLATRAEKFRNAGSLCITHPLATLNKSSGPYGSWRTSSIQMSSRLQLLLELAVARGDNSLDDDIRILAQTKTSEMALMGDGRNLPEVVENLRVGPLKEYHASEETADLIEAQIIYCIQQHCYWPEDLESMTSAFDTHSSGMSDGAFDALTDQIERLFDGLDDLISEADDEDNLEAFKEPIRALGERVHRQTQADIEQIDDRIAQLQEEPEPRFSDSSAPRWSPRTVSDRFDDDELKSLFQSLATTAASDRN